MNKWVTLLVLTLCFFSSLAKADLVLTSPPRGTEAEDKALYGPIAAAMSEWLNTRVTFEYSKDFTTYSFRMREGRYDILFDGAHFSSWRNKNLNHEILANLPEKLVFLVVAPLEERSITDLDSLIGKKVCAQAPPMLGTLFLMSQYSSPAREPILQVIETENKLYDLVKAGKCQIGILRDKTFLKMTEVERSKYRVLYSSRPVPNVTMTAGPRVTPEQKRILVEKLTHPDTAAVAKQFFGKFSKQATHFEPADSQQFEQLDVLLKDFSYGW